MKIKKNWFFYLAIVSIIIGIYLRFHNLRSNTTFTWDQETAATHVWQMWQSKKPLLIGPRIGPGRFFLPPAYYYLVLPFMLLFQFSPISLYCSSAVFGIITGLFFYFFSKEILNKQAGLLATSIYFLSPLMINFDRIPWNVNLLIFSSMLVFLACFRIFLKQSSKIKDFLLLGLGIGLGFQAHLTAVFFLPLVLLFVVLAKKLPWKLIFSLFIILISFLPLLIFDLRHDFLNYQAILDFLTSNSNQYTHLSLWARMMRNLKICLEMIGKILIPTQDASYALKVFIGLVFLLLLLKKIFVRRKENRISKKEDRKTFWAILMSIFTPALFLGFYHGSVPEYYFFISLPAVMLLIIDVILNDFKIFTPQRKVLRQTFLIYLLFVILQILNLQKEVFYESLFYKEAIVQYILSQTKGEEFKLNFRMDEAEWARQVGFDYLFKVRKREPAAEAKLEFIIACPFKGPMLDEGYKKFGAYGVLKLP